MYVLADLSLLCGCVGWSELTVCMSWLIWPYGVDVLAGMTTLCVCVGSSDLTVWICGPV